MLTKIEPVCNEISLYHEWNELEKIIKTKKYPTKDSSFSLSCRIFSGFVNCDNLKDLVNKYNNSCNKGWNVGIKKEKFWILEFQNKIVFDPVEDNTNKIGVQISEICNQVKDIESMKVYYMSEDIVQMKF